MIVHTNNYKKLQPHWDGKWTVKLKGPCNLELTNGNQSKVVHVNHVRQTANISTPGSFGVKKPIIVEFSRHRPLFFPPALADDGTPQQRYPLREQHPQIGYISNT